MNFKKKEKAPDGSKDENVFDIEQGVAIGLFIKKSGLEKGVWRGDIWGKRLEKYQSLAIDTLKLTQLNVVKPTPPHYLYHYQDPVVRELYEIGMPVPSIMPLNSVGLVTSRDKLAISFTEMEMQDRIEDFSTREIEDARQHYDLGDDVRDWRVGWAQDDIKKGTILRAVRRSAGTRCWAAHSLSVRSR